MTFEELMQAGFVPHHRCSICGEPVGYRVHVFLAVALFDPTCACPGRMRVGRTITHDELAAIPSLPAEGAPT